MNNNGYNRAYYQPTGGGRHGTPYQNYYVSDTGNHQPQYNQPMHYTTESVPVLVQNPQSFNNGAYAQSASSSSYYPEQMQYPRGHFNNGFQYPQQYYHQSHPPTLVNSYSPTEYTETNPPEAVQVQHNSKSLQATAASFIPKEVAVKSNSDNLYSKDNICESNPVTTHKENDRNSTRPKDNKSSKDKFKENSSNSKRNKPIDRRNFQKDRRDTGNEYYAQESQNYFPKTYRGRGRNNSNNYYQNNQRYDSKKGSDNRHNYTSRNNEAANRPLEEMNGDSGTGNSNRTYRNSNRQSQTRKDNGVKSSNEPSNSRSNTQRNYNQYNQGPRRFNRTTNGRYDHSKNSQYQQLPDHERNQSIASENGSYNRQNNKRFSSQKDAIDHRANSKLNREEPIDSYSNKNGTSETVNKAHNERSESGPIKPRVKLNSLSILDQDDKTQRETLIDLLTKGSYECMVCCDRIKPTQAIWSCNKCFNCFHLGCTKKWAGTSQGEPGWRCPACQNLNSKMPSGYFCFCKKLREPEWNRREIPHSCGEMCGKKRENSWCTHKCTSLCHPGPCLECSAFVKRTCQCGKTSKERKCSIVNPLLCDLECEKLLNCGVHKCVQKCHTGECEPCKELLNKECFCGKEKKCVECTEETANEDAFSCLANCERELSCGQHFCDQLCHSGNCKSCDKTVDIVTSCPCGKKSLEEIYKDAKSKGRTSCKDPIPTCLNICGKILKCGTPGNFHQCQSYCHEGLCPQCPKHTAVKCRCGFMDKNIPCEELLTKADEVLCERQCKKLRQCGRHKCGLKCCIDVDHLCTRVCGKTLKCRQHKCQEPCHRGNCPRCWETSFDELSCHCGAAVTYPPIPCGTDPPACSLPCRRPQSCSHNVSHTCHADPKCPPCTTLVSKPCFGQHMTMKSTPCYVSAMSCGELCAKVLPCGIHKCLRVCHSGGCIKSEKCNQRCTERRNSCDHPCNSTCHKGPCPNSPCKEKVSVMCVCGNRKKEMICSENDKEFKSLATSKLASVMHSMNSGGSVDISQIFSGTPTNKVEKFKRLECNDDCGLIERNRRLALALQITNPFSRESLGDNPLYPESMKEEAKKDVAFATSIHNALNDLVIKAKESKQKNRSHSFAPMNRDKRRFIHEYSKFFGCQSQSYDEEPKKNVVVTACKLMSQLPPVSVVTVIQRELGQRKVPGPVLNRKTNTSEEPSSSLKKLEKSSSFEKKESSSGSEKPSENSKPPIIDYFDFS